MKRVAVILLIVALLAGAFGLRPVKATEGITVQMTIGSSKAYVNSVEKVLDQPPVIDKESGRTLVPFRFIGEAFGGTVGWDPQTRTVRFLLGGKDIILTIDSKNAYVDSVATKLDVAPKIISGRTMVPVRFISESVGAAVNWNAASKVITITITPPAKQFVLRVSIPSVPTDAHTQAFYKFKEAIEKSTNGQITVEVHDSGSLYGQGEDIKACERGDVEMTYASATWLADQMPELSMFASGYMFKDYNHMTKVMNGEIGKQEFDRVTKVLRIRPLAAFYLGTRELNLRDIGRVVRTPADLKGVKLRMPNGKNWLFLGQALGATPTPLSFSEVYLALKTGTIDGQDNPLPTDINAKFYEVTKYIILTDHYVDQQWPIIYEKVWEEMGVYLQQKMLDAIEVAREYCDKTNLDREESCLDFLKQHGLTVIIPDKEAFIKAVQAAYLNNKDMSGNWNMNLYKKIKDMGGD